jgi:hypothetical protein
LECEVTGRPALRTEAILAGERAPGTDSSAGRSQRSLAFECQAGAALECGVTGRPAQRTGADPAGGTGSGYGLVRGTITAQPGI